MGTSKRTDIGPTIRIGQEILYLPYVGFFSSDKGVKLVGGGSAINGATPSSLDISDPLEAKPQSYVKKKLAYSKPCIKYEDIGP